MDWVTKLFDDPTAWVAAVVVYFALGVLADLARPHVARALSKVSRWVRERRLRQLARQEARVTVLATDGTLLVIAWIRASMALAIAITVSLGGFVLLTAAGPDASLSQNWHVLLAGEALAASGGLLSFRTTELARLAGLARREYVRRLGERSET